MVINERTRATEFLLSEGAGYRSREEIKLNTDTPLAAGTILGRVTATGNYRARDDDAGDGSEIAAGILYANAPASENDQLAVVIVRDAEVHGKLLTGLDEASTAALADQHIIVR